MNATLSADARLEVEKLFGQARQSKGGARRARKAAIRRKRGGWQ